MEKLITSILTGYDLNVIQPSMDDTQIIGAIIFIAQIICYGAALIILLILGIKFITAAPDGKAQIKEKSIPAVIGAIFLFAVGSIIKIVATFGIQNIHS